MANIIKPKRSNSGGVVPTTSNLTSGELGVNMADKKVYINNGTAVVQVGAGALTALSDVVVTSPTTGQNLQYNGTSWVNATAAGSGTVTSVGITPGTGVTVSNSPITTSGNIAVGLSTKLTAIENLSGAGFITQNGSGAIAGRTIEGGTGISVAHGNGSSQNPVITNSDLGSSQNIFKNVAVSGQTTIVADTNNDTLTIAAGTGITLTTNATTDTLTITGTGGTVTSVTGTSPVASSGGATPAISLASGYGDTQNPYASKTANNFLAAPNGTAGVPTFRAIVAADIPTLNQNTTGTASNVTGTVAIINGGTGQTTRQAAMDALAGAVTAGQYLRGNGADVVMSAIQAADVPTLNQNTTGSAATLTTGRTIAITGDLTYTSGSFNGSANVTGTGTLANSGVTAGSYTYASVTVDAKGRVTAASNGTAPQNFPSGTALLFAQTAAPTGWTKSTTHNNKALRVVSGTASSGGTVAFTTAFASQAVSGTNSSYALTTTDIPGHTHSFSYSGNTGTVSNDHAHGISGNTDLVTSFPQGANNTNGAQTASNTNGTQVTFSGTTGGANANHTHSFSGSGTTGSTGSGGGHTHTFTGTAINLAVQYVDVIIATKD